MAADSGFELHELCKWAVNMVRPIRTSERPTGTIYLAGRVH
jgi:hypothetical protein